MNIEEIKARAEAATPGPWNGWHKEGWINTQTYSMDFGNYEGQVVDDKRHWSVCSVHHDKDIEFIARAREDIPALIATLESKQKQLDAAAERITELGEKLCGRFEPICMSCAYCTDCDHDHSFLYIGSVTRQELAQIDPIHFGERSGENG